MHRPFSTRRDHVQYRSGASRLVALTVACMGVVGAMLCWSWTFSAGLKTSIHLHVRPLPPLPGGQVTTLRREDQFLADAGYQDAKEAHKPVGVNTSASQASLQHPDAGEEADPALTFDVTRSAWHKTIIISATKAELLLRKDNLTRSERSGRLFVPLLTSHPERLCNMLRLYSVNVAPFNNTSDFFIFSLNNAAQGVYTSRCTGIRVIGSLHFMPVIEHWAPPAGSSADPNLWSYPYAREGYRLMGNWRLVFPYTLADMLGYRYVWQLDDDSDFVLPVKTSLLPWMQENSVLMAFRKAYSDISEVTWGLPELARTFLIAERHNPLGTLFSEHTNPGSLDGLFTMNNMKFNGYNTPVSEGWDRMIVNGNCILIDTQLWFQPLVQRFVELIVNTGYHYRFRWNEQSVVGMIWQIFVPKSQSKLLPIPWDGYKHANQYIPIPDDCTSKDVFTLPCPPRM